MDSPLLEICNLLPFEFNTENGLLLCFNSTPLPVVWNTAHFHVPGLFRVLLYTRVFHWYPMLKVLSSGRHLVASNQPSTRIPVSLLGTANHFVAYMLVICVDLLFHVPSLHWDGCWHLPGLRKSVGYRKVHGFWKWIDN